MLQISFCSACGAEIEAQAKRCRRCGLHRSTGAGSSANAPQLRQISYCPACSAEVHADAYRCWNCNRDIRPVAATPRHPSAQSDDPDARQIAWLVTLIGAAIAVLGWMGLWLAGTARDVRVAVLVAMLGTVPASLGSTWLLLQSAIRYALARDRRESQDGGRG